MAARRSSRKIWIVVLAILGFIAGDVGAHFFLGKSLVSGMVFGPRSGERADVILHKVKKEPLNVTVTEKGQLESADNRDIVCKVRAGTKGFATTINWVIDEGTRVNRGQLIMILDDSALRDQEDAQSITVQEKYALKVKADKDYEIQLKTNDSSIALAETTFILAEIDLDKLTGFAADPALIPLAAVAGAATCLSEYGSYRQQLDDLSGKISIARSTLEQNRERSDWAQRMVKQSYMSPAQAQAEKSRLDGSVEDLRSLEATKALLISHDRRKQVTDLTSKRDNARRDLDKARLTAEAQEVQARTTRQTQQAIYEQALDTFNDIKKQRLECRIKAPDDIEDGSMVVYFKADNNRFGNTSSTGLIEQGAQVKEGQKMLRIPNLVRMQVNTKIHEAMMARIRGDLRVPTHIVGLTQAGLLFNPDLFGRVFATQADAVEKLRDKLQELDKLKHNDKSRDVEYERTADGQKATIRIDSVSDKKFVGYVKNIANMASQVDMMMSDVKLYQTYVRIEGELTPDGKTIPIRDVIKEEGELLKPDMTAEVTISVDAAKESVLTVPIQAIIGGAEMGAAREVYVKTPTGYERKPVILGLYNEKMIEVRTGLNEGDEVVVNPKVLLGDKDKTKTRDATDQNQKGGKDKGGDSKDADKNKGGGKAGGGSGGKGSGVFSKGG